MKDWTYEQDLSDGWSFTRRRMGRRWVQGIAPDGPDAETVDLPHCWNTTDTFSEGVAYHRGSGSYRLRFRIDPKLRQEHLTMWRIETEGFYGIGDAWLNGTRLGDVDGQYLGVRFEVTGRLLNDGENILAFRLTNRCPSHVLPGIPDPDFLLYGGLSGRVRLVALPEPHIDRDSVFIRSLSADPREALLQIEYVVSSPERLAGEAAWTVNWRILAPDGCCAAETPDQPVTPGLSRQELPVPDPTLWSPDQPALYIAEGTLRRGTETLDRVRVRMGIRDARFVPDEGFFLNGKRLDLRGANRHEDIPGFGRALPEALHRMDAQTIRDAGLNFVRLSHYPQHPAFLDACDELGLLVYAEIATWKSVRRGRWLENACRQMQGMIERDRNHPSVILWGMGNESQDRVAYRTLQTLVRSLDPTRPTIYAENHLYRALRKKTFGLPDVWGANYELDRLDDAREGARLRTVVVSECSNRPDTERGRPELEREQVSAIQQDLAALEDRPFVAGFALWCFNDYATLRKRRYRRFSGMVDAWRIPKNAFHLLRARYASHPVLQLSGVWGEEYPADVTPGELDLFTNGEDVQLWLGTRHVWSGPGAPWTALRLEPQPETLRAVARFGKTTCTADLPWHGRAAGLRITPAPIVDAGKPEPPSVCAFLIEATDECGNTVRSWAGPVGVRAEGAIRLFPWRRDGHWILSGGRARVFAQRCPGHEPWRIRVDHPSLGSADIAGSG